MDLPDAFSQLSRVMLDRGSGWSGTAGRASDRRDDFQLLGLTPPLAEIGRLVRHLEQQQRITLRRDHAAILSSLPKIEPAVRAWIDSF